MSNIAQLSFNSSLKDTQLREQVHHALGLHFQFLIKGYRFRLNWSYWI